MPAGVKYDLNAGEKLSEFCRVETIYRLTGGFNLVIDNLEAGSKIPPMTPLAIDFATRKATVVKNVQVVEDATATDTEIKIKKGSQAYIGMILGTGTKGAAISSIDKSSPNYDVLTIAAAFGEAVKKGDALFEASAAGGTTVKNKANFLNYAWTKVEPGAAVDAIGQVFEIRESRLVTPISDKDRATLKGFFIFVP